MNVYFDVDQTLICINAELNALRPGAAEAMRQLKHAGHDVYVWSASGLAHVERVVALHGLNEWVDGMHDKDPRVQPPPDYIIDDDWYLVEKWGGYCVSQYRTVDEGDGELLRAVAELLGG